VRFCFCHAIHAIPFAEIEDRAKTIRVEAGKRQRRRERKREREEGSGSQEETNEDDKEHHGESYTVLQGERGCQGWRKERKRTRKKTTRRDGRKGTDRGREGLPKMPPRGRKEINRGERRERNKRRSRSKIHKMSAIGKKGEEREEARRTGGREGNRSRRGYPPAPGRKTEIQGEGEEGRTVGG